MGVCPGPPAGRPAGTPRLAGLAGAGFAPTDAVPDVVTVAISVPTNGATPIDGAPDQLYHILYDGTVVDEERFTVLGGEAEAIAGRMDSSWAEGWTVTEALRAAVSALAGPDRTLGADELEVAALARGDARRAFRRIEDGELAELLGVPPPT